MVCQIIHPCVQRELEDSCSEQQRAGRWRGFYADESNGFKQTQRLHYLFLLRVSAISKSGQGHPTEMCSRETLQRDQEML